LRKRLFFILCSDDLGVLWNDLAGIGTMRRTIFIALMFGAMSGAAWSQQKQDWKKIKADNGAWAAIDMNSITPWSTGGAYAIICISDDGRACTFLQMTRVLFDCHGHFKDIDHGAYLAAPPQSLGGGLAAIACNKRP
jgi:hypothetical protein